MKAVIDQSQRIELSAEIADWHVNEIFSDNPCILDENGDFIYTEEAQDIFNKVNDEIKDIIESILDPTAD
tara:strand:+ start:631 stop:840 length:210 start_codon:yes stop_codon:yes gene_type:complete